MPLIIGTPDSEPFHYMIPALILSSSEQQPEPSLVSLLLVDDDPDYLDLSIRLLSKSSAITFQSDTACTVNDAFEQCLRVKYDCLLVDYQLPDGNGTDIIDRLSEHYNNLNLPDQFAPPTIIITADNGQHAATQAIRAGAVDFLAKRNVTAQSLRRTITHALEKSQLEHSVRQRTLALEHAYSLLENANTQLESKRRELLSFYHTVSHEVKTPLAAAREFISLIRDGAAGDINDGQNELLGYAMDSCDQIKYQFTELLDLARMDSGKLRLTLGQAKLNNIVKRSVASVIDHARDKGVSLNVLTFDNDLNVYCDIERIVQVLSNLLTNAVRFTEPTGTVTLSIEHLETVQAIRLVVTDTGCGIDEQQIDLIFERLYQVEDADNNTSSTGLGLGLSICQELLALHGSQLSVNSRLGSGSEFSFTLPQLPPSND